MVKIMNILYLYKDYYPVLGGIENHVKVLAEAQAAAGHQVIVLVCDLGQRTRIEELNREGHQSRTTDYGSLHASQPHPANHPG